MKKKSFAAFPSDCFSTFCPVPFFNYVTRQIRRQQPFKIGQSKTNQILVIFLKRPSVRVLKQIITFETFQIVMACGLDHFSSCFILKHLKI